MHQHDPLNNIAAVVVDVEHAWSNAAAAASVAASTAADAVWRRQNSAWDLPLDGPLTLQAIWTMLGHLLVTRYLIVASFALGFYDYFLTLPQEQAYVWKSRPSVVRTIYFFVRYSYFPIGVVTLYGEEFSMGFHTHTRARALLPRIYVLVYISFPVF
jgi:hypothetical protein